MKRPPQSATNMYINLAGVAACVLGLMGITLSGQHIGPMGATLLLLASYLLPVALLECWYYRRWREWTTARNTVDAVRLGYKILGLVGVCGLALGLYWMLPEYRGSFYDRYYDFLLTLAPWFVAFLPAYFIVVDRYHPEPEDGYWHFGRALAFRSGVDRGVIGQFLLGWLVKFFFLPLMFIYLIDKVAFLRSYNYDTLFSSFQVFYDFLFGAVFFVDLLIITVGYAFTLKLTDSHIRSTEPTFLGWFVAIICYQPFWSLISAQYLAYHPGRGWGSWWWEYDVIYVTWGCLILACNLAFVFASVSFGLRFSNLTHRGILTNGLYRYCKHPAYIAKNLSYWLISMPFMVSVSVEESLRHCLLLLGVNVIYLLRARTEERHLSRDPDYIAYAQYIEEHGWFRKLGQWIPALRFKPGALFYT